MVAIKTRKGSETLIEQGALDEFRSGLGGETLTPEDAAYGEIREIWNAMIDSRPALIARCRDADDVVHSVKFARANDLLISVRGAGHNIAGNSLADGGLLIDLSQMAAVEINAEAKTARVEPGATLATSTLQLRPSAWRHRPVSTPRRE